MDQSLPDPSLRSTERDEMLDQMQSQIGELLKVNQELCSTKNQNEVLKEQLINNNKEKKLLNEKIQSQTIIIQNLQNQLSNLQNQNQELIEENTKLKENINSLMSKQNSIEQNIESEISSHTTQLKRNVDEKEQQIQNLNNLIDQLKEENEKNNNELMKMGKKLKECKNKNLLIEKDNEALNQQNNVMSEELNNLKSNLETSEQNMANIQVNMKKLLSESKKIKAKYDASNEKITEQEQKIINLEKIIEDYRLINPKLQTPNELRDNIVEKRRIFKIVKNRYLKLRSDYEHLFEQYNNQASAIKDAANDLSDVQENALNLQKQLDDSYQKINDYEQKISSLTLQKSLGKAVIKANTMLMNTLSIIETKITPDVEHPSFRNLIIATIMLKRWCRLIGYPKAIEIDVRNWWWLHSSGQKYELLMSKINEMLQTHKAHVEEVSQLKETIENQKNLEKEACKEIEKYKNDIELHNTNIEQLNNKIHTYEETISSMISSEDYLNVVNKYREMKEKAKSLRDSLKSVEELNESLTEKVQILEQENKMQHNRLKLSARTTDHVRKYLSDAHDQIGLLKIELDSKSRENCALERNINKNKISEAMLMNNLLTITSQNSKEIPYQQFDTNKCQDVNIRSRLNKMSENLITTEY